MTMRINSRRVYALILEHHERIIITDRFYKGEFMQTFGKRPGQLIFDVYSASDYAGIRTDEHDIYFGYEFGLVDQTESWGFRWRVQGEEILSLTYAQMMEIDGCPPKFKCEECLLFGIGLALAKGVV